MLAVAAAHAGEAALEVAAIEKLIHDLRDDGVQEAVTGLIALLVGVQERVKMPGQALPQRRGLRLAGTIDLLHPAAQSTKVGVSSNGTPQKIVGGK